MGRLVFKKKKKKCLKHTHFNSRLGAQGSSKTVVYTMYKRIKGERYVTLTTNLEMADGKYLDLMCNTEPKLFLACFQLLQLKI